MLTLLCNYIMIITTTTTSMVCQYNFLSNYREKTDFKKIGKQNKKMLMLMIDIFRKIIRFCSDIIIHRNIYDDDDDDNKWMSGKLLNHKRKTIESMGIKLFLLLLLLCRMIDHRQWWTFVFCYLINLDNNDDDDDEIKPDINYLWYTWIYITNSFFIDRSIEYYIIIMMIMIQITNTNQSWMNGFNGIKWRWKKMDRNFE